ncbi:putative HAF family extracellular repeat protein [Saccharothrix carnea]|uniref:Putative HAF family extracellular repeat protein n=1 Tax=Saccharothrix carnea TaxID=1280637 RepID=A0A2P8HLQ5_SACCR|nr:hypothetical protein [Saccharothrix carnea]PSL47142.1 putative HAF family extracellular repeat protein [Saccharothrix carnea]
MPDLRTSLAVLALATALPLATTPAAAASATHVIAELQGVAGLPGTLGYHPTGVNDLGQIIGSAQGDGLTRAVLWAPRGGATDLGPGLAGAISQSGKVLGLTSDGVPDTQKPWVWSEGRRKAITPPGAAWALAQVINDDGSVPMSYATSPRGEQRATVWDGERHVELPVAGDHVSTYAINNAGVVAAGYASASYQQFAALRCAEGACTELLPGPGYGTYDPEAINEAGVIVANRGMVALRWDGEEMTVLSESGRLAHGEQSLNERGDAVGWVLDNGMSRAVLWPAGGKQVDLGVPDNSVATAINERGDIIGHTSTPDYSSTRVFLWRDGQLTYLDSLGGAYSTPVALNNHGVVVGRSTTADGTWKGVRWTPVTTTLSH